MTREPWQRRWSEIKELDERLEQLLPDIRDCDESELPGILRAFQESPLGRRFRGLEDVAEEIRDCYCAEQDLWSYLHGLGLPGTLRR